MRRFLVFILIILAVMPILAQDEPDFPFITQSFFSDGVEIIEIYPIADNENRVLHIYDDGEWLHLPYPVEIESLDGLYLRDSYKTPYLVSYGAGWLVLSSWDKAWRVYRDGRFYEHTFACNPNGQEIYNYMRSKGQIAWIYTYLGDTEFLCNMATNEISPELPEEESWGPFNFDFRVPVEESPDGRYLVLLANANYEGSMGATHRYRAYSYDTQTQTFRFLGDFGRNELVGIGEWLSDTHVVLSSSGMSEGSGQSRDIVDVTQINSVRHYSASLVTGLFSTQITQVYPSKPLCIFSVINNSTLSQYPTGNLCDDNFVIPNSDDRLHLLGYPMGRIVRANHVTGERLTLFIGEVEAIDSISPEGGYAIITLGTNGVPEGIPDDDTFISPIRMEFPDNYTDYVINLADGQLIGAIPNTAKWVTETQLYTETQLLSIIENGLSATELNGAVLSESTNEGQLIIHTTDNQVILYDVINGDTLVVIPDSDNFSIVLNKSVRDSTAFLVNLSHPDNPLFTLTAMIRLPN